MKKVTVDRFAHLVGRMSIYFFAHCSINIHTKIFIFFLNNMNKYSTYDKAYHLYSICTLFFLICLLKQLLTFIVLKFSLTNKPHKKAIKSSLANL